MAAVGCNINQHESIWTLTASCISSLWVNYHLSQIWLQCGQLAVRSRWKFTSCHSATPTFSRQHLWLFDHAWPKERSLIIHSIQKQWAMVVPAHKRIDEIAAGICGNRPAFFLRASISDISQGATLYPTLRAEVAIAKKKHQNVMRCLFISRLRIFIPKKQILEKSIIQQKSIWMHHLHFISLLAASPWHIAQMSSSGHQNPRPPWRCHVTIVGMEVGERWAVPWSKIAWA